MASACIKNIADNFPKPAAAYFSYGWLSPRTSVSRDDDVTSSKTKSKHPDPVVDGAGGGCDFEFRLDDPVTMLTADELFSDGKLMPLHFTKPPSRTEIRSPERTKVAEPKAPRCSSRWREILGFKKIYQTANSKSDQSQQQSKSNLMKRLLHKRGFSFSSSSSSSSSSSGEGSFNLPLLKDLDSESILIASSRLSLSSSSSGHEHDDLPRLSLDFDKPPATMTPGPNPFVLNRNPPQPRIRIVKSKPGSENHSGTSPMRREQVTAPPPQSRGVSADSPRMNSSGKIVFQNLERSSSSPSSFNGGPRLKHRGMERSYSANVRVTPVLNVNVCSLRGSSKSGSVFGFGPIFSSSSSSPQKRGHHQQQPTNNNGKNQNRTDQT